MHNISILKGYFAFVIMTVGIIILFGATASVMTGINPKTFILSVLSAIFIKWWCIHVLLISIGIFELITSKNK